MKRIQVSRGRVAVLAFAVLWAAPAMAQDVDPTNVFGIGPSYRTWDMEPADAEDAVTQTISQFHIPFSQTIPIGTMADLVAYGAYARTTLDFGDGEEATLSGITDVRLKGIYRPGGRAQLSVGVNLPVGKQTLKQGTPVEAGRGQLSPLHEGEEEGHHDVEIAQAMWSPILGFRTKRMGAGFDIEMGAGYAVPLSPKTTLGLAAAYVLKGEYDLFETEDGFTTFKPGPEASATIGFDFRPSDGTLLRLDLTGRNYGDDESNDVPVFKTGTQIELDATVARTMPRWSFALRARNVSRSDDELLAEVGDEVVRTGVSAATSSWALGEVYAQVGNALALGAEIQAAAFGESETVLSDGKTIAVGPGLRIGSPAGSRVTLKALYLKGDALDGDVDLSGFDVSAAAAFAF